MAVGYCLVSVIMQTRRGPRQECDDLRGGGQRLDPLREVLPQRSPYDHQGLQRTNTKGEVFSILNLAINDPNVSWT